MCSLLAIEAVLVNRSLDICGPGSCGNGLPKKLREHQENEVFPLVGGAFATERAPFENKRVVISTLQGRRQITDAAGISAGSWPLNGRSALKEDFLPSTRAIQRTAPAVRVVGRRD